MLDWSAAEAKLHAASLATIEQFAAEHADELICFFAFDSDPKYGYVLFAFDTFENNIRSAQNIERAHLKQCSEYMAKERDWTNAKYRLTSPTPAVFNTNCGDFAYPQFAEVKFPEWVQLAKSRDYPVVWPWQDNYLDSNVRILFWNVAQQLLADRAFQHLRLASPFMIGYGIHDEEEAILRIVNWPSAPDQTTKCGA